MAGEGSIYRRRDGRWVATISRGPRGSRQIRTVYRHTKAEARAALDDLRVLNGRVDRRLTVSAYLERWLRDADVRDTTRHGYQAVITNHLNPAIGAHRLVDLSPLDVRTMMATLKGAPKTRRNVLVVLRKALREAVRSELVPRNVASPEYVDAPKVPLKEPDVLTWDETDRLLSVADDELRDLVIVALGTGLRAGEQIGLRWQDINGDTLRVEREVVRVNRKSVPSEPKTESSKRTIPLNPDVQAALDRQRARVIAAGFVPIATGPVFIDRHGGVLVGATLTHRWYRLLEQAEVKRRPWKILRATFLSRLRDAGVDDADIQPIAGHAPGSRTTRRHYIGRSSVDLRSALTRTVTDTGQSSRVAGNRPD